MALGYAVAISTEVFTNTTSLIMVWYVPTPPEFHCGLIMPPCCGRYGVQDEPALLDCTVVGRALHTSHPLNLFRAFSLSVIWSKKAV